MRGPDFDRSFGLFFGDPLARHTVLVFGVATVFSREEHAIYRYENSETVMLIESIQSDPERTLAVRIIRAARKTDTLGRCKRLLTVMSEC